MFKRRAKINDKSFSRDPLQLKSRGGTAVPALRRADVLRGMLADLRNQEIERLKSLVRSELDQEYSSPGDASDAAQVQETKEFNVSLIELSESRLGAICAAFDRLENGHYGLCEGCAEEIAFERLRVVPTALYCVDCQAQYEADDRARRAGGCVAESEETLAEVCEPRILKELGDAGSSAAVQHEKRRAFWGHRRELR